MTSVLRNSFSLSLVDLYLRPSYRNTRSTLSYRNSQSYQSTQSHQSTKYHQRGRSSHQEKSSIRVKKNIFFLYISLSSLPLSLLHSLYRHFALSLTLDVLYITNTIFYVFVVIWTIYRIFVCIYIGIHT